MRILLKSNTGLSLIFLIILLVPGIVGVIHPGFFTSDDGNWMIIRFAAFYNTLRHGQFPVRYLPQLFHGYGYPVSNFLYPLFMYLGVPLHLVGLNFLTTIKVLFGMCFLFSGVFTFLWLRKFFDTTSSVLGSLAGAYFPYHVWDMYKRGSIGEMLALTIVPYILWQIEQKNIFFVGLGIGCLILAHNSLAALFLPVLLLYYFLRERKLHEIVFALLIGLGVATFFWMPALVEKQYTVFDTKIVSQVTQYFLQNSSYYLVGFTGLLGFIGVVIGIFKKNALGIFWGIVFFISLFFSLPMSNIFWHILPLAKYIQFPFRFLSLTTVAISFLVSYCLFAVPKKYRYMFLSVIVLLIVVSVIPILSPKSYQYYPDSWYSTNQDSTTVQNEYLPIWVKNIPAIPQNLVRVKGGSFTNLTDKITSFTFQTSAPKATTVTIAKIFYPGWNLSIDGQHMAAYPNIPEGFIAFQVPSGMHNVKVYFTETPLRIVADCISLLAIGIVIFGMYLRRNNK